MKTICSVPGCRRRARMKGFCRAHYLRLWTGRPMKGRIATRVVGSPAQRLRAHLKRDRVSGCHLWTGYRDRWGVGQMAIGQGKRAAHRVAWEIANGPIPAGMLVLHRCGNRACCNPAHLKLGTPADKAREVKRRWVRRSGAP